MRYFDINDNELQEEELDFELGYCEDDKLFIQHHDAIEAQPAQTHYAVTTVYFEDGTSYTPTGEDDPHITTEDPRIGRFEYIALDGEEPKEVRGMSLREVIDVPQVEAVEAWDEYEDIQRYKLYTPEEKIAHEEAIKAMQAREELLATGLERLIALENYKTQNKVDVINMQTDIGQTNALLNEGDKYLEINLQDTNQTVDDLTLALAELFGAEE